ncbi:MAG: HAMP domain-containing histidine kinase [Coriobacteriia bacterium]|nr:HAMP domain-containing histidine kinase [Coriobacteriia bacterium]
MKLWQKIFLLTLTLVIIVVNASSLALLTNNHHLAIEREQQNALARHNYLDLELRSSIIFTQLMERKMHLTEDDTQRVASSVLERQQDDPSMRISLYQVFPTGQQSAEGDIVYLRLPVLIMSVNQGSNASTTNLLYEPDFSSVIEEVGGMTYLYIVSTVLLSDQHFRLITSFDISTTYELFRVDFNQVRFIGVISALIVSGMLLLLVRGLLSPLRNLSGTTRLIASGDLEKRAKVKGNDEVAAVARSLNTMADSIESNVKSLEELAESRRVFISNLAHEMKTPLTSILGFADILRVKRDVSDEERVEYASVIVSETKRLQELSGKLMELLFVGNLQTTPTTVEVHEFASELASVLKPIVTSHSLDLVIELPDEPLYIKIDKELMKSFVFNLVNNSIKASSPGDVIRFIIEPTNLSIQASLDNAGEDLEARGDTATNTPLVDQTFVGQMEFVKITVVDEGIGIPADEIPLIVEPFYMLDKARTRKHGGAGLGLALCAEIAQAHNSELVIKSVQGRGTAVSVLLSREEGDG